MIYDLVEDIVKLFGGFIAFEELNGQRSSGFHCLDTNSNTRAGVPYK